MVLSLHKQGHSPTRVDPPLFCTGRASAELFGLEVHHISAGPEENKNSPGTGGKKRLNEQELKQNDER